MKNSWYKKGIVFGIIILFIGMSVVPSTAIKVMIEKPSTASFDGNTFYVGGSGPGNYTKIQDAIDNASGGDTVFVYDDSSPYFENLVVEKSINLIGEDRNTTIIDGDNHGDVVHISSNSVTISGFTIQNSGEIRFEDGGIDIHSHYNTITDNNILDNIYGITMFAPGGYYYNIISGNNINSNIYNGIDFIESNFNKILDNNLSNNCQGIYLASCERNIIAGNRITSNNDYGLFIPGGDYNTVRSNIILSNNNGLYLSGKKNTIVGNHITSNNNIGIDIQYIGGSSGWDNTIKGNNITSNNGFGIHINKGRSNNILKNNFIDNELHAFFETATRTYWDNNYWEGDESNPVRINGMMHYYFYWADEIIWEIHIPWENYDWNPAKEPHDITDSHYYISSHSNSQATQQTTTIQQTQTTQQQIIRSNFLNRLIRR